MTRYTVSMLHLFCPVQERRYFKYDMTSLCLIFVYLSIFCVTQSTTVRTRHFTSSHSPDSLCLVSTLGRSGSSTVTLSPVRDTSGPHFYKVLLSFHSSCRGPSSHWPYNLLVMPPVTLLVPPVLVFDFYRSSCGLGRPRRLAPVSEPRLTVPFDDLLKSVFSLNQNFLI